MITVAVICLFLALIIGIVWPRPEPALVCVLIAVIALIFKFAP